jgi:hypothetical protein
MVKLLVTGPGLTSRLNIISDNRMAEEVPALARNTARILASIKMLEINISDMVEL